MLYVLLYILIGLIGLKPFVMFLDIGKRKRKIADVSNISLGLIVFGWPVLVFVVLISIGSEIFVWPFVAVGWLIKYIVGLFSK
jgi:hypothetical protein